MSITGRIRDLLRGGLDGLVDSDTTLDDGEDEEESPPPLRVRPAAAARLGRRSQPLGSPLPSRPPAASRPPTSRPPLAPRLPPDPARLAELYQLLEVPPGTDLLVVKQSYRRLLRLHHPDIVGAEAGSTERVQLLIEAYAELCLLLGDS